MEIHSTLDSFSGTSSLLVLGLGNFDGLHLGHQALLTQVLHKAREKKGKACVFTFREHPQGVLHPKDRPPLLTSLEHRMVLLERMSIDLCFLISFTQAFSVMPPDDFIRDVLKKKFGVETVVMGYNAHFGHDRQGDGNLMRKLAKTLEFEFVETPPVSAAGNFVSSTRIRNLIHAGNLNEASTCLGRHFGILAKVISGDKRGRTMGYPTANLDIRNQVMPPEGVYPVLLRQLVLPPLPGSHDEAAVSFKVRSTGPWLKGVLNYGKRPTFETGQHEPWTEIHILDFNGNLYGEYLEVIFCPRVREELKFKDALGLRHQIAQDIVTAKAVLDAVDFSKEDLYKPK